ncbi:baculoviral IAP repeat-containing protein 5 isoform X2 [Aquila chrysaetos chrysaetos]|uniref:baculoviral IAP repeat-containing protein 5 isoform X2 n=1 Tax=Aquila chrysaetos chrysaetos TaxID=223781 RepID=UPI001176CAB7|nr:baculoviral IAP repeat-containing protein 5 isoform X2 [Aquila chrysaetos chrysaetos]
MRSQFFSAKPAASCPCGSKPDCQVPLPSPGSVSQAETMAAAGFVHCPSENGPDVAQCFFCFKELEGWEPDDDPLEEHQKHSAGCAFLSLQKDPTRLTLQEFLKLDKERMKNAIKKEISQKVTEVEDAAKSVRREIENLVS